MTCVEGFFRVLHMFTDAQILYLTEVLGTAVDSYRAASPVAEEAPAAAAGETVVLTASLELAEQALLTKILASVNLSQYKVASTPEEIPPSATHILSFGEAYGRRPEGQAVWWGLPALSEMLGAGPEVAAHKKAAWATLQLYQRESGL